MSYIKGTMTCHVCSKEYKYCWLYADGKFERVPSRDEYVEAYHNKQGDKYIVSASCTHCHTVNTFYYNENGILIGE